ncbi:AMP-binding protein [Micromonospora yangpuensis]|uniref:Acyl-CoA synthetase (AMP-forming)/AMP-acid ligase II n=1 Tax=Micromonospora yangpuensis TaxID=683228 RepID=A0A1C6UGG4_9ACTN|nr:AMP-binding protein [Micromonospora yangpuensis]GGM05023.1 AMP-dependent acyl-CoA synthetase [Micromonospora yangpuensis]SCL53064.1 Acyl-CoA synthetase (AMP-forming)/AMP-acid ligase II [Micromonospora yangpuensis]
MRLVAASARLIDAASGATLGGDELADRLAGVAAAYAALPPGVVFARSGLTVDSVLRYAGAVDAARPVALLDPALDPAVFADFVVRFEPVAVVGLAEGGAGAGTGERPKGYREVTDAVLGPIWVRESAPVTGCHPDLAVLLATSGSTGDPKFVRLSRTAVLANAAAIGTALDLGPDEIAPTNLPLYYSFGLSVLNSHLAAGAAVLVVDGGVLAREFWQAVATHGATSLAGVPYHYEMLHRIRWSPVTYPSVRTLTQAGGRLRDELVLAFHERITATGGRFHVMWGCTEAAPRMSTLPADALPARVGSVGPALAGGSFTVRTADGTETTTPGVDGELVYRGPNVMLGYAEHAADLARGDENGGVLRTGDLGHLDADGFVWLRGRLARFGKVFGVRVNLHDIEELVADRGPLVAVSGPDRVVLFVEGIDADGARSIAGRLAERLRTHRSGFDVRAVDHLPQLPNGKIDYRALEARV